MAKPEKMHKPFLTISTETAIRIIFQSDFRPNVISGNPSIWRNLNWNSITRVLLVYQDVMVTALDHRG